MGVEKDYENLLAQFFQTFSSTKFFVTHRASNPFVPRFAERVSSPLAFFLLTEVFKHRSKPAISLSFQSYPQLWITLLVTYSLFSFKKQRLSHDAKRG
jgi:hypothetical protein